MAVTSGLMLSGDFTFPSSGHVAHDLQPAAWMVAQLGYPTPAAVLTSNFASVSAAE